MPLSTKQKKKLARKHCPKPLKYRGVYDSPYWRNRKQMKMFKEMKRNRNNSVSSWRSFLRFIGVKS